MRILGICVLLCMFTASLVAADNVFLAAWKVNTAKSQFSPGPGPKNIVVTFSQSGDQIRRTVEGVNGDGTPISLDSTIKWDGQDHAVTNPTGTPTTVAAKLVNDHTVEYTVKMEGKVMTTGRAVVSKDGKTMTSTETGVDPKGQKVRNVIVSERQ